MIKGTYCFIFATESDPAPKYAISLAHMKAKIHSSSQGLHQVAIETSLGDVEWELAFEQKANAQKFVDVFQKQAVVGETDEVRKVKYFISDWNLLLILQRNKESRKMQNIILEYWHSILFFGPTFSDYSLNINSQRLGHEGLINKRGSVKYAETIAQKKLQDQPEKKENVLLEDVNRIDPMTAAC